MQAYGPYRIERLIAVSEMARVHLARDERGQRVALKVLEEDMDERFEREANMLASLRHPGIVRYIEHGRANGKAWLATEWLDGESLAERLERPIELSDILAIARGIAGALAHMHACGVIHRDVKPANVFLVGGDARRVRLLDFGLSRHGEASNMTAANVIMGTPSYMPPEQALDARSADARADVFALGALIFHCVTGRPIHTGASLEQLFASVVAGRVPRMSTLAPFVPSELDAIVAKATAWSPGARHPNAVAMLAELERVPETSYCEGDSVTRIRASPAAM